MKKLILVLTVSCIVIAFHLPLCLAKNSKKERKMTENPYNIYWMGDSHSDSGTVLYREDVRKLIGENTNRCIVVANKEDLGVAFDTRSTGIRCPVVVLSCLERTGLGELKRVLADRARSVMGLGGPGAAPLVLRARHRESLRAAREALVRFKDGVTTLPPELLSIELREAREALAGLTGEIVTEEILDRIFRDFCIGK